MEQGVTSYFSYRVFTPRHSPCSNHKARKKRALFFSASESLIQKGHDMDNKGLKVLQLGVDAFIDHLVIHVPVNVH